MPYRSDARHDRCGKSVRKIDATTGDLSTRAVYFRVDLEQMSESEAGSEMERAHGMSYDRMALTGVSAEDTDYPDGIDGATAAEREVRTWLGEARKKLEIALRASEDAAQLARKKALEVTHARIRLDALETALERMGSDATAKATETAFDLSGPGPQVR
jgi:hypothetical protein